jgi:hypothetical protein
MSLINVSISTHTTKSLPRPHIVYFVDIRDSDETRRTIPKRYSEAGIIILRFLARF